MNIKENRKIAGQNYDHIVKSLEKMFQLDGNASPLYMKNHLAVSFFRMIISDEEISDKIRNIARTYLQLYEFLTNFDE